MLVSSGKLWENLHNVKVPKHGLWKPKEESLVRDRIAQSSTWSQWAPQLLEFVKESLVDWSRGDDHVDKDNKERVGKLVANGMMKPTQAAYALHGLSAKGVQQFRKHCLAGHRVWRSDCAACLDAMAFSKPHKRLARSRICSLIFDVSGPHRAKPKYFIVGCYNFPVFDLEGVEAGEEGSRPGEDEGIELLREEPAAEAPEDGLADTRWDVPEAEEPVEGVPEEERSKAVEDNKRWETIAAACKEVTHRIIEIPLVEILPAKSSKAILGALNRFYAKLRSWGLPVYRSHSDCAREYTQESLRQWASHRGI